MYVTKVTIKNFRSIVNQHFEVNQLNVIVGTNDVGKSNFLKALNLFFNGETDVDTPFRFEDDFSQNAKHGKKQAKEISIEIEFTPPISYKGGKGVVWKKRWRKDGPQDRNEFKYIDGQQITGRTKIKAWLYSLTFKYVPAIKSEKYFENLLRDLHDTLSETTEASLKEAGKGFIDKIRLNTGQITKELFEHIGIQSNIDMPNDLRGLFASLEFQTISSNSTISLKHRGDGIKIRHIPVILHFLAVQQNKYRGQGSARVDTIWGFEEPENNLELQKCFDLADKFLEYSKDIQIFTTTHSPAFYTVKEKSSSKVSVYEVVHSEGIGSKISPIEYNNSFELDNKMGLMPIVAKHILRIKEEKDNIEQRLARAEKEIKKQQLPVLFVEGKTDKTILEEAIKEFGKGLHKDLKVESSENGGYNWVKDNLHAWMLTKKGIKAGALFDNDLDALTAKEDLDKIIGVKKSAQVKTFKLAKPNHIISIAQKGIKIPFSLEEMYPPFAWHYAEQQGWLEERADIIAYNKFNQIQISFIEHCQTKSLTDDELIYVKFKVKHNEKTTFRKYISSLNEDKRREVIKGFANLVIEFTSFFQPGGQTKTLALAANTNVVA